MSANNWTKCPKCEAKLIAEKAAKLDKARKSYGKVTAEEYEGRMALAQSASRKEPGDTLREDYEIGIDGSEFFVSYYASCHACGFKYQYKIRQSSIEPIQEPTK